MDRETRKQCSAIFVRNNAAKNFLDPVQVLPLTSSSNRLYLSETYFTLSVV